MEVQNLVEQLDRTQIFFKISACISIISLFRIFAFTSNNFIKKQLLKLYFILRIFYSLS